MNETLEEFYNHLLGIESPWEVTSIERNSQSRVVTAIVEFREEEPLLCPECLKPGKLHDHRSRTWRHLDSCNHQTLIKANVPRVDCSEHGVKQVPVLWAEKNSRFTMEFESTVILWLKEDSISTVASNFDLTWDQVDGIMKRAVQRGLSRREKTTPINIGIDETSFQKRHEYITVILDKNKDVIIDILDDRKAETLNNWFKTQKMSDLSEVNSISMDMWDPFINAVKSNFEKADKMICFDRFHVAQYFGKAVDKIRAEESRMLASSLGINPFARTRFQWLKNSERTDNRESRRKEFLSITKMNYKTSRAWRIKETAAMLWDYSYLGVAEKRWKSLLNWISHCRLIPMIKVGKMIRRYFWGILNAIKFKANNSMLEAKNNRIQRIKKMACGFRNRDRFKNAIMFHLGGLDLFPAATR